MCDANDQNLAYVYGRANENEARQAKVLTDDEARRIAINNNIARLPELLRRVGGARAGNRTTAFALNLPPEVPGSVSPLEREKRLSELSTSLLALERREEALIERAAADGTEVIRRPDANPMAVLGVVIVAAKEAALSGDPRERAMTAITLDAHDPLLPIC